MSVALERPLATALPAPDRRTWLGLAVVLSATFMALFDFFVVNVAAPSMQRDLHASSAAIELVVGGYAFAYASGMVTGGRLGDLYGHRRLFMIGMVAFAAASALCGLARTPDQLVGARLLQGAAGAAMVPQVLALISTMFTGPDRAKALAWFGVTGGVGSVAGQVLGGMMLDANLFGLAWRPIFLVNVPVGIVAVVLALRFLPAEPPARTSRLDPVGAIGISAGLGLILVPLALGQSQGWPTWAFISMVTAVPVLYSTVAYEKQLAERGGAPTLDIGLFGHRSFVAGLVANGGFYAFFGSFMLCLTIVLQSGLQMDPRSAGLTFAPMGVIFAVASVLSRPYVVRYGGRAIMFGATISGTGMVLLAVELLLTGGRFGTIDFIAPLLLLGLGNGIVLPAMTGAVLAGVRPEHSGSAAGVLTTTQQFSSALGVAVLGAVFFGKLGGDPSRADFAADLALVAVLDAALILVTIAASRLLPQQGRQPAPAPSPQQAEAAEI